MKRRAWNSTLPAPGKPIGLKSRLRGRGPRATGGKRRCYAHLRDEGYKAEIRLLPCLLLGRPDHVCKGRVEFSHVIPEGRGGPDVANGLPLCGLSGHREGSKSWHVMGKESFPAYWGLDLPAIAAALLVRYQTEEEWQ